MIHAIATAFSRKYLRKIWQIKEADPVPKAVLQENEPKEGRAMEVPKEEILSINDIKGKRKSTGSVPVGKRQRLDHVVRPEPHNFTAKDYSIFGAAKLDDKKRKEKGKGKGKVRNKSAPAPSYFTEPNFGKVKQTSKMARRGNTDSFTYQTKK